ncbi:hypothetical protein CRYUN_Cryun04dG0030400 [Craigia yunnanensis]
MAKPVPIEVWKPNGKYRVVSTKSMPGTRWINLLIEQDCRVEICTEKKTILSVEDIIALIGHKCDGVIGQTLFAALSRAGGTGFSNMAVGYNNVDVNAANKYGVAVGNTPGVLTETTEELAASLSLATARRIVEADEFMRAGLYDGWLHSLSDGVIGAGRIGSAYARMMVEGFKMNLIYYDLYQATRLEKFCHRYVLKHSVQVTELSNLLFLLILICFPVAAYGEFLKANGEQPVYWKRASTMDKVLREADISLHPVLDKTTYHLVNKERLAMMKKDEPFMKPGLAEMKNAVIVPHIASASKWTHEGMATLAVLNVLGKIKGYPIWGDPNRVEPFLNENVPPPAVCPSIVNAKALAPKKAQSMP